MSTSHTPHQDIAWVDAHGGDTSGWQCSPTFAYANGAMDGWSACLLLNSGRSAGLSKHIALDNGRMLMLSIAQAADFAKDKGTPIRWGAVLKVGEGRHVRACGYAADFPAAFQEATSYQHESRQIGPLTWWRESEGSLGSNWISWLGEITLRARQVSASAYEPAHWYFETSGRAPTFEEAALLASMHQ